MADISDMVEFEFAEEPNLRFPVGAGGPIMKLMRFFYPIPIHLLHMFTGPVSLYSFFHILRQARGEDNMFKKQWDRLRTRKDCERCGGFEHEVCPICESRGVLPFNSKFAQTTWTDFHNPELLEKADAEGREISDLVGGEAGKLIGRAKGLRTYRDEADAEVEYSMSKLRALGGQPGALPCKGCNGEGVIKCQGCHGDASVVDNWPDVDYYTRGPGRALDQWIMINPSGQPVTDIEQEFLRNDPYTAKWWAFRKYLLEGEREYLTLREKEEMEDSYDREWYLETLRQEIAEKRPGWQAGLEVMKREDPAWVFEEWAISSAQGAPSLGTGNDPLTLMENFEESPEMRRLRYQLLGPQNKLLEFYGLDPATKAQLRHVPKDERQGIKGTWDQLHRQEVRRWAKKRRETNNWGLPEKTTPELRALLEEIPQQVVRFRNEQRGDELLECLNHPAIQEKYVEYVAALESGNESAASAIFQDIETHAHNLSLFREAVREEKRQREREDGLASIRLFKKEDVEAGRAAIDATEGVVSEIVKQEPQIVEIQTSLKEIEETRDSARQRLEALPSPPVFFLGSREWFEASRDARRYEFLHTIESAELVRRMSKVKQSATIFPLAQQKAQAQLAAAEEDQLRRAEERRLGRDLSREEFRSTLVEQWKRRVLNRDELERVYENLGAEADDVIIRLAVREARDRQLEQAHRDAGRLGEREDQYVALKFAESQKGVAAWENVRQLTSDAYYAGLDERLAREQKERAEREAVEAKRAKIAKRGQIGTRLAETFQPVTKGFKGTRSYIMGFLPRRATTKKESEGPVLQGKDEESLAKYQRELARARAEEEKRAARKRAKEDRERFVRERREALERGVKGQVNAVKGAFELTFVRRIQELKARSQNKDHEAEERRLLEKTFQETDKALARIAEKLPRVEASSKERVERIEAQRRAAADKYERWETNFLRNEAGLPIAEAQLQLRKALHDLEDRRFALEKFVAVTSLQRLKDDEQAQLDKKLRVQAKVVRQQLEREKLSVPDHVDIRRFLVEGVVRPDVLRWIFDKEPLAPRKTRGDQLLESPVRADEEREKKQADAKAAERKRAQQAKMSAFRGPLQQREQELRSELENVRRTFLVEAKRPALDDRSDDEKNRWRSQWDRVGQDDWVSNARASFQLALNPKERRPVAFASLNASLMGFGGPARHYRK